MTSVNATQIRNLRDCSTLENEYWTHVSAQEELPLANAARQQRGLARVDGFVDKHLEIVQGESADDFSAAIASALLADSAILSEFRLLTSISDKRTYLDLSYLFTQEIDPTDVGRTLCGCPPYALTRHSLGYFQNLLSKSKTSAVNGARAVRASEVVAKYLIIKGIHSVLNLYAAQTGDGRKAVLEKWLLPSDTQQNEAKRRGHGAEAAIAAVLKAIGCAITPPEKDVNPMGAYDPNISLETFRVTPRLAGSTFSSDIAILDSSGEVRAALMSLVQSSDPGQFGVNKSDEIVLLRGQIDRFVSEREGTLELWGLVDGVGYSENKTQTINKMLANFHYFVQNKSSYKAGLRAHELGVARVEAITFDNTFYPENALKQMSERYVPDGVRILDYSDARRGGYRPVLAGKATLWLAT